MRIDAQFKNNTGKSTYACHVRVWIAVKHANQPMLPKLHAHKIVNETFSRTKADKMLEQEKT